GRATSGFRPSPRRFSSVTSRSSRLSAAPGRRGDVTMWLMMRHASETFWISSASLGARLLRRRPAAAGRGQRWKLGHQREIVAVSEANRTLEDHRYPEGKAPTDDASRMDVSAKLTLARLVAI